MLGSLPEILCATLTGFSRFLICGFQFLKPKRHEYTCIVRTMTMLRIDLKLHFFDCNVTRGKENNLWHVCLSLRRSYIVRWCSLRCKEK